MKADWWRSWHGAPTDPKWQAIARRAKVATALVVAVAWALFGRASANDDDRGSIAGFDAESLAVFLGIEEVEVTAIVAAMTDKGVLVGDRLIVGEAPARARGRERRAGESLARGKEGRTRRNARERSRTRPNRGNPRCTRERDRTHANAIDR
jgi:hypothetical protein